MIAELEINLSNIKKNWMYLDTLSTKDTETGAVLKADAYSLGVREIAPALWEAGARSFFVATTEEALELNNYLPQNKKIYILNGYNTKYRKAIDSYSFIPVLNTSSQLNSFIDFHPTNKTCLQIDIGMKRLGFQDNELKKYEKIISKLNLDLLIGHLSCADEKENSANGSELLYFNSKTNKLMKFNRSIAASHGIFLGQSYHFNVTRPGIALFGGVREKELLDVVNIKLPVLQSHYLKPYDGVGYGLTYKTKSKKRVATLFGGYADGIIRNLSQKGYLYHNSIPCPILGRISMDLVTVDISHLKTIPKFLNLLGSSQSINDLADKAGTISHEILTSLGSRFLRTYIN